MPRWLRTKPPPISRRHSLVPSVVALTLLVRAAMSWLSPHKMASCLSLSQPFDARLASGIFPPQRIPLRIDGSPSSPRVLAKKLIAIAHAPSYSVGVRLLKELGDVEISARGLNKTAARIGAEMVEERDIQTEWYFQQPLPRQAIPPKTPMALACVSVDGGRMQTRDEGGGRGVHNPHWRETKNSLFMRMSGIAFTQDPHPCLPACFADRKSMKTLLSGVFLEEGTGEDAASIDESVTESWRPERLFRTCLSSLCDSNEFGRMMQVEADLRGFYRAQKKAFVCDGLLYNWTIQQRHFKDFTAILDFIHVVEKLYTASRCVNDEAAVWHDYLQWVEACWQGKVCQVIVQLQERQQQIGRPPDNAEKTDPRKVLAGIIGYLQNNQSRMNYPDYRQNGLPVTSAHMESFVKELNHRVKGTEKFWDDGASGEVILQIRAAALCDDDRLVRFLANRPGHPFHPNVQRTPLATAS